MYSERPEPRSQARSDKERSAQFLPPSPRRLRKQDSRLTTVVNVEGSTSVHMHSPPRRFRVQKVVDLGAHRSRSPVLISSRSIKLESAEVLFAMGDGLGICLPA